MSNKKRKKGIYLPNQEQAVSAGMAMARLDRKWKMERPNERMTKSVTLKFDGAEWLAVLRGATSYGGDDMVMFQRIENLLFLGDIISSMMDAEWKLDKYGNGFKRP
jgi:hypothetical protein